MLQERLKNDILVFDGAMGTQLQDAGLKAGDIPECLNITDPKLIQTIHLNYLNAGADFITTNTFGANPLKMAEAPYSYEEIINAAIDNATIARKTADRQNDSYIVLDIGPIGQLLEPMGTLTFDEAYEIIKKQVIIAKDKVDAVLLETMTDIYEVKAGILAVKENSDLPVFVTMTYENNLRTLSGCDPLTMVNVLEGLNVDVLGVNCSLGPIELTPIIDQILAAATIPVLLQPNAGLPCLVEGKTCYNMDKETFVQESLKHVKNGVAIIGGCCGTTPDFIASLKNNLPVRKKITPKRATRVSSGTKTVEFGHHVVVCGERLNPTGKKKLKLALKEERYDELVVEAIKQDQAGAHVLDVNVGLPGINEVATMKHVIKLLQEVISLPLQIDSSVPGAIEQACRYYNGKPLINSVNGKDETMDAIFPIVKKYGGVVIGLTLDENGIPPLAKDRYKIAKKIINKAASYGITKENIIIDCLVLTVSAQQKEVMETVKAVAMVKELGVHTVLGVSNVSFGLPNRPLLNKTFLAMAMSAGLDLPIINPMDQELMATIDAFNVLYNYDHDAAVYIERRANQETITKKDTSTFTLNDIVLHGLKDEVTNATKELLKTTPGLEIINNILIPALDTAATKGPIIMATVHGDIHDIGKNIVKVVLESYGYKVIDLGKDVPPETVVEAFHKHHPKAIGLSALMTTTVVSMAKTIELLKQIDNICPIFVGGAVLTADYAKEINADYYSKDAMEAVELLNKIIK